MIVVCSRLDGGRRPSSSALEKEEEIILDRRQVYLATLPSSLGASVEAAFVGED